MTTRLLTLFFLFFSTLELSAQVIDHPNYLSRVVKYCEITKIERNLNNTIVYFRYTAPSQYIKGGWVCAGNTFYLRDDDTKIKYKLIKANNIPICPKQHNFKRVGEVLEFNLVFEALPNSTKLIDVVESDTDGFNFYGVTVKKVPDNSYPSSVNIPSISTNRGSYTECDKIISLNATSKPDFEKFLAGVKHAVIIRQPEIKGHVFAFDALFDLLNAMGFESVQYYDDDFKSPTNPCESVIVDIQFDYDLQKFSNVKWIFISTCLNYRWEFNSNRVAAAGYRDGGKANFYNLLRSMYQYRKSNFNSVYTLQNYSLKTCWTEQKIKENIQLNGYSSIEGIYERTNSDEPGKYKIAVRKINGLFYLIYLSGARMYSSLWKEGDIKAVLEPTSTAQFYKAKWFDSSKTIDEDVYITFEQGAMNYINNKKEKDLYIKLYPLATSQIKPNTEIKSSGSGFAISSNGYIVTNYHVTEGASKIRVRGINGDFSKSYSAKLIIDNENNDLSIIKIDDPYFYSLGLIPYTISNRGSDVGTSIFVLGFPMRASMGDEMKLTNGIISSKSGYQGNINFYQMTAPVQPGNSGGPMFDNKGNLVGIVNSKHIGAENASYAIKSSNLLNLIDILPDKISLQTINNLSTKSLTDQVKILQRFTYIIEIN